MAKFYVQSGSVKAVVDSADLDRAALWVVNVVMGDVLPLDQDDECEDAEVFDSPEMNSHHLGETIRISEQGFDRDDAWIVDSLETFRHWYELFQAVSAMSALWKDEQ